jgi:hypothetical protein
MEIDSNTDSSVNDATVTESPTTTEAEAPQVITLNLRKAAAVLKQLQAELKNYPVQSTAERVSLYETSANITAILDKRQNEIIASAQKANSILEAISIIRSLVARKNAEVNITGMLAEDAMLAAIQERVSQIADSAGERPAIHVINAQVSQQIDMNRNGKTSSMYGMGRGDDHTVSFNVFPAEMLAAIKAEGKVLARKRRKLQEQMIEVNLRTKFEIPPQVSALLAEFGID